MSGPLSLRPSVSQYLLRVERWMHHQVSVLAMVLHLASGITTAVGLFATANVFTALLAQGPSLDRVVAAGPALVAVLGLYALRGLLDTALNATKALLAPRLEQAARDALNERRSRLSWLPSRTRISWSY